MKLGRWVWGAVLVGLLSMQALADDLVLLTTTDFSSGSLATVDPATYSASVDLLNVHGDAVVRTYQGKVYVVNRKGQDNVLVLDPSDLTHPLLQFSVGNGANPQDIAFVSETKAYIPRLESTHMLVVNPTTGDSLGAIDLSFAADADGFPEAAFAVVHDGFVFVTCQRLDQNNFFAPTDASRIAVVDVAADTVVDMSSEEDGIQAIVFEGRNPFAQVLVGDKLYLSCVGSFFDPADGGIEVVDLKEGKTAGLVMGEAVLGGNVGALAMASADSGYVVVSDSDFVNTIKGFDLGSKVVSAPLTGNSGGFIPEIAVSNGRLYVSDQGSFTDPASVGFRVYDTASNALIAGPISTGLPPNSIAFLSADEVETALAGDFDGDNDVDFDDYVAFASAFGSRPGETKWDPKFDLDRDGRVDFDDFAAFARSFGQSR